MYKSLIRPVLYSMPAENAHYFTAGMLQIGTSLPILKSLIKSAFRLQNDSLKTEVMGLSFPNPVGLAAGFDKDARWIEALETLGFGFIEIGTITPKAQPGNSKPRLFRLVEDEALINRMGFNNAGVENALSNIRASYRTTPLGGNIGKNKITKQEDAPQDYLKCFKSLYNDVDYFTVNVSSPNTPGLRELQNKEELKRIFDGLLNHRIKQSSYRPIALKIAPDLSNDQISDIVDLVFELKIDGLIATNTTISRKGLKSSDALTSQSGGVSGKPVTSRSTEVIRQINDLSGGKIPIIGVGGIHSPQDAKEKLQAGAKLIQLYTGFIYEGPYLVNRIKKALIK